LTKKKSSSLYTGFHRRWLGSVRARVLHPIAEEIAIGLGLMGGLGRRHGSTTRVQPHQARLLDKVAIQEQTGRGYELTAHRGLGVRGQ